MPTFFSPEAAATRLQEIIQTANVERHLQVVAIGLIAVFCLLNLYRALITGSLAGVMEAFLRAGIAGLLVQNSGLFTDAAISFFRFMQEVGSLINTQLGDWQTLATIDQLLADLWNALWASSDGGVIAAIFNLGEHLVFGFVAALTTVLFIVFYAIAIAIYNFLVFMALVTLVVATFVAPLSFAFLAHRFTQPFVFEWLQVILHASLVILIAQAIVGIVVSLAVVQPLQDFVDAVKAGGSTLSVVKVPVAALIGLGVGIFALLNVQGIASAFVGRVESVAGATAAALVGARLAAPAVGYTASQLYAFSVNRMGPGQGGTPRTPPGVGGSGGGIPTPGAPTPRRAIREPLPQPLTPRP